MKAVELELLMGERKICPFCGWAFKPLYPDQIYCTARCATLVESGFESTVRKCPVCNNPLPVNAHKGRTFCSKECQLEARNRTKGWNQTKRHWENLREFVLERDDFTCQDCGKFLMNVGLEAHHIKPLFQGGSNDEKNLITLCHKCHKKRHMNSMKNQNLRG